MAPGPAAADGFEPCRGRGARESAGWKGGAWRSFPFDASRCPWPDRVRGGPVGRVVVRNRGRQRPYTDGRRHRALAAQRPASGGDSQSPGYHCAVRRGQMLRGRRARGLAIRRVGAGRSSGYSAAERGHLEPCKQAEPLGEYPGQAGGRMTPRACTRDSADTGRSRSTQIGSLPARSEVGRPLNLP